MATITPSISVRNAMLATIKDALEAGAGPALIDLYTGTKPAGPDSAITSQVKLGTMTCSDPTGTISNGEFTFSPITQDGSADNSGTATWARLTTSSGAAVIDVDAGTIGGTAFLQMNTTAVVATGPISISSLVIRA